ncbi:histone-lysine N-methyltransferase SETMAR [Trichonephila clavipes]|nr:histone-lysine N-methyltransferase SETMAR [Trichonephila clavipes]
MTNGQEGSIVYLVGLERNHLLGDASAWPNTKFRSQQLDHLKTVADQKLPELVNTRGVVFHQDNARPHTSVVTRQDLWELGWEVLMQSPYCLDLAPSDYHIFLALINLLRDKKLG